MFFSRYTSVVPSRFFPPPASPTLHPSFPAGSIDFSHLLHRPCIPKRPFPISPPNKCRFPISPPISASAREAASPTLQRFPFSPQTSPPASFNFNCYAVFSQVCFLYRFFLIFFFFFMYPISLQFQFHSSISLPSRFFRPPASPTLHHRFSAREAASLIDFSTDFSTGDLLRYVSCIDSS
ncbi:hypothetical protein LXL04_022918 [Taraxacum kok-saghyz]